MLNAKGAIIGTVPANPPTSEKWEPTRSPGLLLGPPPFQFILLVACSGAPRRADIKVRRTLRWSPSEPLQAFRDGLGAPEQP